MPGTRPGMTNEGQCISTSWPGIAVRRTACFRTPMSRPSTSLKSLALLAGDLFHQIHDPAAQPRVLDVRERLGQRQAIGARQEVGDVVGNRRFREAILGGLCDGTVKKEG